jgi:hypothetical protein
VSDTRLISSVCLFVCFCVFFFLLSPYPYFTTAWRKRNMRERDENQKKTNIRNELLLPREWRRTLHAKNDDDDNCF